MAEPLEALYFAVTNIPVKFRSADLRNYFSQFIESCGFICFHYRHRPEVRKETASSVGEQKTENLETDDAQGTSSNENGRSSPTEESSQSTETTAVKHTSCCCVVSVHAKEADRFMKMYSGNQWINSSGNWLAKCCIIRRVRVSSQTGEIYVERLCEHIL